MATTNDSSVSFDETDTRHDEMHIVTQQTQFALVHNILQHPKQLPSMYELEQLNPSMSEAMVYKHIQKLIDADTVEEVCPPG